MTQDFIRFDGTSNNPKCDVVRTRLSREESEMTTEALVGYTLNKHSKHKFKVRWFGILQQKSAYTTVFHKHFQSGFLVCPLLHCWCMSFNTGQQMAAKISATLVSFTGCAAGPFGPSAPYSDVHQRLAEVEPADNQMFRSALVKLRYQTNQDVFKETPVTQTSQEVRGHQERGLAVVNSHVWRVSRQVKTWGWRRGAPLMH